MGQGKVIRLDPRSEQEFRAQLREIGFNQGEIDENIQLVLQEVGNFDDLEVVSVFRIPEGQWIIPEKKSMVWRPKGS